LSNEFAGKTALVTGASRGIGAATAIALAKAGVRRVVIHYNSYREGAEKVLDDVRAAGAEGDSIQANLAQVSGIEACVAAIAGQAAEVDILINNAGSLIRRAPLADCTAETYDEVMNLNVKSVWQITQAVAPSMISRRSGVIVNVSSIAARTGGGPGATVYAAAKAAVSAMTRGVAKELAPKGIRVNAISPGTVDNYFHEQFSTREMLDMAVANTPLGRLATNEEMADTAVFLCSDASRYVIGQTIELNGGMFMV
jgi:3-oxoacyl-[acyl-carrier protein] reductase